MCALISSTLNCSSQLSYLVFQLYPKNALKKQDSDDSVYSDTSDDDDDNNNNAGGVGFTGFGFGALRPFAPPTLLPPQGTLFGLGTPIFGRTT